MRHILVKNKERADEVSLAAHSRAATSPSSPGSTPRIRRLPTRAASAPAVKGPSVEEFDKFVFDAKTGDLSEPVKTQFGYHVIEVRPT